MTRPRQFERRLRSKSLSFAQQQGRVWRLGFLSLSSLSESTQNTTAFMKGLRDLGYIEGKNLVVEWRFADGSFERLTGQALELVQLRVDVIVAVASAAIGAAKQATSAIPIVMATTGDPVGSGFVKSLARPGGNITGLSYGWRYRRQAARFALHCAAQRVPRRGAG